MKGNELCCVVLQCFYQEKQINRKNIYEKPYI